ncbi:MAG: ROK family protein, partial [Candidatus Dormibacterales bacterium]
RGSGRGVRSLAYVTWSTGIGCGLVVEGRLYSGAHGTAGEVGHMVLDPGGPLCACGQRGCLEAFSGGAGLRRRTGRGAAELCRAAAAGEAEAGAVLADAARHFGQAMVNLTNLFDPEVIVVGGGLTRSWALLRPLVWAEISGSPFVRPYRRPRLNRTRFGDRVGLVGAVEWARANT